MTDYELNNAIANLLEPSRDIPIFDLNNWNDLMPLIVDNSITLYKLMTIDSWQAFTGEIGSIDITINNRNPQRALAECLLQVLEAKR